MKVNNNRTDWRSTPPGQQKKKKLLYKERANILVNPCHRKDEINKKIYLEK